MPLRLSAVVGALGLGCAAVLTTQVPQVEAAAGCSAVASATWRADAKRRFRTEAFSNGPSCGLAVATIVVRGGDGKAIWADARAADSVMTLAGQKTRAHMGRALGEWLRQDHGFKTTADLPEWKKDADTPMSGEFQFLPEAGIDREAYEEMRRQKQPVFCYVQGMESMACLGLSEGGMLDKIGLQLFPG